MKLPPGSSSCWRWSKGSVDALLDLSFWSNCSNDDNSCLREDHQRIKMQKSIHEFRLNVDFKWSRSLSERMKGMKEGAINIMMKREREDKLAGNCMFNFSVSGHFGAVSWCAYLCMFASVYEYRHSCPITSFQHPGAFFNSPACKCLSCTLLKCYVSGKTFLFCVAPTGFVAARCTTVRCSIRNWKFNIFLEQPIAGSVCQHQSVYKTTTETITEDQLSFRRNKEQLMRSKVNGVHRNGMLLPDSLEAAAPAFPAQEGGGLSGCLSSFFSSETLLKTRFHVSSQIYVKFHEQIQFLHQTQLTSSW